MSTPGPADTGADAADRSATEVGDADRNSGPARASRGRLVLAGVVAAVVLVVAAFSAGFLAAPRPAMPSDTSVEAGFARDMQTHHNQAVEMSLIVRDRTSDPDIRSLAYDIATSQSQQSGQMYAWLNLWGLPQASSQPDMTWMLQPTLDGSGSGHDHADSGTSDGGDGSAGTGGDGDALTSTGSGDIGSEDGTGDASDPVGGAASTEPMVPGGPMPGMATAADLERLASLDGVEAERLYLELMIAHHQGGVEMAEAVKARSTNPLVTTLADAIIFAQSGEITYMTDLLTARR